MTQKTKGKKKNIFIGIVLIIIAMVASIFAVLALTEKKDSYFDPSMGPIIEKPVIYLYPIEKQDILVQLAYKGDIIASYPAIDPISQGWSITAHPNGRLTNHADGKEYSYLFWEGVPWEPVEWDLSTGFVVKGSDTREFLQYTLSDIGLTPQEYNEFIVYWYPRMKDNSYNLIHFVGEEYTQTAPLTITPSPDSVLRVFMVFKALDEYVSIEPQNISSFKRKGFTVIEWGGSEIE